MARRAIRLKEMQPSSDYEAWPSEQYVEVRGGTIERKGYRVRTDRNAFITSGSEHDAKFNMLMMGDSIVECLFVEEALRLTSAIERRVNSVLGTNYACLNAGYSGATSLHIQNTLLNKVIPIAPNLLVFMTGIMDIEAMQKKRSFWSDDIYLRPVFSLDDDSGQWDTDFRDILDIESRYGLHSVISATANAFKIPLCHVSTPHLQSHVGVYATTTYTVEAFDLQTSYRKIANETVRKYCNDNSVAYFDVERYFCGREDLFYDDIHLNASGCDFLAEKLIELGFAEFVAQAVNVQSAGITDDMNGE